ncbi:MAG: cysteine desulfurase family protein [Eubacteriales bacterium]|nr:cysteine desulfurase family protein [Clostridiales bacterium]MDY5693344.1 cysteine desulfurase family protein [Eubacteriales bacterium]
MIYLDNSATTRTLDAAAEAAAKYMRQDFFNPSAAYSPAVEAERAVNAARSRLASMIHAAPEEIIYTSGGTESNNTAIFGALKARRGTGRIIVGATEHPSVYSAIMTLKGPYNVTEARVDSTGTQDVNSLMSALSNDVAFVSIMHVNNETGAINDIPSIYKAVKQRAPGAIMHVDGVQGFLKVPFDARYCDMYSISGHKFHAPKGVGALYIKRGVRFAGGQIGGGQERNLRSGTTNTPGIMGMDAAIEYYQANLDEIRRKLMQMKLRLAKNLSFIRDAYINGPEPSLGAPHILNVSFLGVRGEVLLHALEEKGIYVSTGSACSAHKKGKNRILNAMGVVGDRQEGAIRFSICPFNTEDEMDITADVIEEQLAFLRRFKRR